LEERLGGAPSTPAAEPAAVNPEAYRLFLKAAHQARTWSEEGFRNGLDLYQQAIAVDPSHAPSYAGLALSLVMMGFYGFMPGRDAYVRARAAARQALQLEPTNAEAHAALSAIAVYADHNAPLAISEAQEAVRLKADVPVSLQTLGTALMFSRRFDEALAAMRKAVELDPLTTLFQGQLAWILHCVGRDDEAWELVQSTLDLIPTTTTTSAC
jgi:tetratricopeptide (TPR) repeat protein